MKLSALQTRISKSIVRVALLALTAGSATALFAADDATPAAQDSDRLVTEFRGRPPFKRQVMSSDEIVELARFEESASSDSVEGRWVIDYSGKPPYKREFVSADEIVELARFEEADSTSAQRSTRRGPPGKPNFRR